MPNNPNFNYAGLPNYGYPNKQNEIGLLIGSLLGAGLGAASGQNTGDALLRGAAGGIYSYGAGLNNVQDYNTNALNQQRIADYLLYQPEQQQMEREGFQMEKEMFPINKQYKQSIAESLLQKTSPEDIKYGNTKRQLDINEQRLKNRKTKKEINLMGQKQPNVPGMSRLNEWSGYKNLTPEQQADYMDYLSKTGYNRTLGMDEEGNPIFVPSRGNVALNTPASNKNNVSGKNIQPLVKPTIPSADVTKLSDFKTLLDDTKSLNESYDKSYSGPIQGRISQVKENYTGGLSEEQLGFNQILESLKNRLIYLRSGAQINENEFKRLMKELPDVKQPDSTIQARLLGFQNLAKEMYNNRLSGMGAAGYRNVEKLNPSDQRPPLNSFYNK